MKDYYAPTSYYELDNQENECHVCQEKDKAFTKAGDFLQDLIRQLYSKDKLDTAKLDDTLGELCYMFDVQLPTEMPNIERKKEPVLQNWIDYNNEFLKQLA